MGSASAGIGVARTVRPSPATTGTLTKELEEPGARGTAMGLQRTGRGARRKRAFLSVGTTSRARIRTAARTATGAGAVATAVAGPATGGRLAGAPNTGAAQAAASRITGLAR